MPMRPELRIGLHLKRAEQELIAVKAAAMRSFDLTVPQYSALMFIEDQPGISAAALARLCLVTPQTMATVLTNLEAKHLVDRRPHPWHRNANEYSLTPSGQKLLTQADGVASEIEEGISSAFTAEERNMVIEMLDRIGDRLAKFRQDPAALKALHDAAT